MDVLLQIQYNKLLPERQKILVKGNLSLLILFSDRKLNYAKHVERLTSQLKENVADQSSLWDLLALCVKEILAKRSNFEEGSHLFLGTWVRPYINSCNETERREIFHAFLEILINLEKDSSGFRHKILKSFYEYVLPIIKQQFLRKTETNYFKIPKIAAKLTTMANGNDGLPTFDSLLLFFGDVMRPNVIHGLDFYTSMESQDLANVPSELLVQNWIKFEILSQLLAQEQLVLMRDTVLAIPDVRSFVSENLENIRKVNFGGPAPLLFFKAMFEKYYKMDVSTQKIIIILYNLL